MQEERFRNKVNWISIICAVLVVFLHSFSFNDCDTRNFAFHLEFFISRNIAQSSVPVFFTLSAFLFYRNFDYSKLPSKYLSRLKSLLIPYLLWNFISMIAFYFLSKMSFINTPPFDINFDTLFDSLVYYRYNLVFWFVFQLILLTYLFPLIYPVIKNKILSIALFAFLLWMYGSGNVLIWKIEVKALIFYYFGAYFAIHHQEAVVSNSKLSIWGILAFVTSQVMIYSQWADKNSIYILTRLLMIVAVFDFANLLSSKKLPVLLNCSFPIYAMHNLVLEFFNKVFSFILTPESNLILIDYFGSTIITIMIIAAVNLYMANHLPKTHALLFGGRGK